jgi:metal-responsive CopG/Arc/MetJ family transcriptional regulator
MRTAVSIPDDVYSEAEELLRRLKLSRSELYAAALREFLARHSDDTVTAALNRVYDDHDSAPDPAVSAAAVRVLKQSEW